MTFMNKEIVIRMVGILIMTSIVATNLTGCKDETTQITQESIEMFTPEDYGDFDIEINKTIFASDFGIVPDIEVAQGDLIRLAVTSAIENGYGTRLLFEKGKYIIDSPKDENLSSYNRNPIIFNQPLYHLYFRNAQGVTIEGEDSTFMFQDIYAGAIKFENSDGVSIKGIEIDYEETPWTQGTVIDIDAENGMFTFKADPNFSDLLSDERMIDSLKVENNWHQVFGVVMNKDNPVLLKESANDYFFISGFEKIEEFTYLIYVQESAMINPNFIDLGDKIIINNRGTPGSALDFIGTNNIVVKNVTVYASPLCGIIGSYSEGYMLIDEFNLIRKPDSGRWISANGDGIHYQGFKGNVIVRNSIFEGMTDDGINFYQVPASLNSIVGDTKILVQHNAQRIPVEGETIVIFDVSIGKKLGEYVVKNSTPIPGSNNTQGVLELKNPIEIIDNNTDLNSIQIYNKDIAFDGCIIADNIFREFRGRGIIARTNNTLISGNHFYKTSSNPIVIQNFGSMEGLFSENMTIRNNTMEDCAYMEKFRYDNYGAQILIMGITDKWKISSFPGNAGVRIINNNLTGYKSRLGIFAGNINEAKIIDNTLLAADNSEIISGKAFHGGKITHSNSIGILISNSNNVLVTDNKIEDLRDTTTYGVLVENNSTDILIEDNILEIHEKAEPIKNNTK